MDDVWAVGRFSAFASLNPDHVSALRDLAGTQRRLAEGEVIRREGDPAPRIYLLCSGWTASSMLTSGARQIIKVHVPGDVLGLPSLALTQAADTLVALTEASIIEIAFASFGRLFESSPRLAALLFLVSQEERVFLMDRLASIGRASAETRIAALILQLQARILRNDPDAVSRFHAPLTQTHIADLTALTKVHVNRTLKKLREDGVVEWVRKWIIIRDPKALRQLAGIPERVLMRDPPWLPQAPVAGGAGDGP